MAETASTIWTRILVVTLAALATIASSLVTLAFTDLRDRLDDIEREHAVLDISVARAVTSLQEHEKQSEFWKRKIEDNNRLVTDLSTSARSRPDPFTGTDGKELRKLIDSNERRLDDTERRVDKIEALVTHPRDRNGKESKTYR